MKKQTKNLLLFGLGIGSAYYFFVYLPKKQEEENEKIRLAQEEFNRQEAERIRVQQEAEEAENKEEAEKTKKLENMYSFDYFD